MNSVPGLPVWLQILILIAVEIALVALVIFAVQARFAGAAWRRNLCQAGLGAALLVAVCELSGIGRGLVGWMAPGQPVGAKPEPASPPNAVATDSRMAFGELAPGENQQAGARLSPEFRAEVAERISAVRHDNPKPGAESPSSSGQRSMTQTSTNTSSTSQDLRCFWIGVVWLSGSSLILARGFLAWLIFRIVSWRGRSFNAPEMLASIDALARSLGISRHVRVVVLPRLHCPIAYGLFRPTVGLPKSFLDRLDAPRREAILAHELAHIASHDPFWRWFSNLAAALLWWHPGVWWLRRQLWLASEMAADEASLLVADGPRNLAESLVEIGNQLVKPRLIGQVEMAGFRSQLGNRVQHLMRLEGSTFSGAEKPRSAFVKFFGPVALAVTVILCTAWAAPQALTTGETMKTIQLNWKRSLAALALFGSLNTPDVAVSANRPNDYAPPARVPGAPGGPASFGGNPPPVSPPPAPYVGGGGGSGGSGFPGAADIPGLGRLPTPLAAVPQPPGYPQSGEGGGMRPRHRGEPVDNEARSRIMNKLMGITLPEVMFEGLPLSEVLKYLSDQARKLDPEKQGVNFLINPNQPPDPTPGPGQIDPTTGLPISAGAAEQVDLAAVTVKFNLPLRNIRLIDAIEAVVKVADRQLQFSIEDYGVVISLKYIIGPAPAAFATRPPPNQGPFGGNFIVARTFRVDTNTFVAGLESAFGIKIDQGDKDKPRSRRIQSAMKELLSQLGISMEGNKAVFYNELTGVLMVRASEEDMQVVQAAIETLGGNRHDEPSPGPMVPGLPRRSEYQAPDRPGSPPDAFEYSIRPGDTLSGIVKAHKQLNATLSAERILEANPGLTPEKLRVGQRIFIPTRQEIPGA